MKDLGELHYFVRVSIKLVDWPTSKLVWHVQPLRGMTGGSDDSFGNTGMQLKLWLFYFPTH